MSGYAGVASDGARGLVAAGNIDAASFTKSGVALPTSAVLPLALMVEYDGAPVAVAAGNHKLSFDTLDYENGITISVPTDTFALVAGVYALQWDIDFDAAGTWTASAGIGIGSSVGGFGDVLDYASGGTISAISRAVVVLQAPASISLDVNVIGTGAIVTYAELRIAHVG